MTDRYEKIRKALAMGPTPGSREVFDLGMWDVEVRSSSTSGTICQVNNKGTLFHASEDGADRVGRSQGRLLSDAFFIAACDPDTIRELLAERDALAARQPQQGSVKVKPLEWTEFTFAGLPSFWNAEAAPFGVYYRIERDRDCFWMSLGEDWSLHDTPEEAKAAAQADYERRILSALEIDDERS